MNCLPASLTWLLLPFLFLMQFAFGQISNTNLLQSQEIVLPYEETHLIQYFEESELSNVTLHLPFSDSELMSFKAKGDNLFKQGNHLTIPEVYTYHVISKTNPDIYGKLTVSGEYAFGTIINEDGVYSFYPTNTSAISPIDVPQLKQRNIECSAHKTEGMNNSSSQILKVAENISSGAIKRTFDVAIVATGEFYTNNGSNLPQVQGVIANIVSAWNLIFGKDLAIEFNLLPPVIYTNPGSDPFIEDLLGGNPLPQQAAEAIAAAGFGPYDIGHVLHNTNGNANWTDGGIAGVATACDNSSTPFSGTGPMKAANWSGAASNLGTPYISLTAHEMGHPLGATHTFNGIGNNCTTASIDPNTSYEIGSGSTLMAYNGLCYTEQNIPSSGADDNYFHAVSIEQILDYVGGLSCDIETFTLNNPPECSILTSGIDFSIPPATPFELSGIATDADGDDLLYTIEQVDEDGTGTYTMGKIGEAAALDPAAPLFRSIPPSSNSTRTFPDLNNILAGNNNGDPFEALPLVSRTMKFVFVARDCNPNGGGVCTAPILVDVTYNDPFAVMSQNTATSWTADGASTTTIEWGDADNPGDYGFFGCSDADILFSVDGGQTFPYTLASNVELTEWVGAPTYWNNDHDIIIPNLPTTTGRIKVKCSDGIFFDINNANITVTSSCLANGTQITPDTSVEEPEGSASLDLNLTPDYGSVITGFGGTIDNSDNSSSLAFKDMSGVCGGPGNPNKYDVFDFQVGTSGSYVFDIAGGANGLILNIYEGTFDPDNVCSGWVASSGLLTSPGLITDNDNISTFLNAGATYQLVVSSFDDSPQIPILPRNYSINISGGTIFDGVPEPSGFSYNYVVVDESNGLIKEISVDPDLSNATIYPQGNYKVYGLSWDGVSVLPAPGTSFDGLISDIINLVVCAQLSTNCIEVAISCSAGNDDDGDGVCNDDDICNGTDVISGTGDDTVDTDGDGIPDDCDECFGTNTSGDSDADGICDDEDEFPFGGCGISDNVLVTNISPCNDGGTINNPDDDYYTADVTIYFELPAPAGATHLQIFVSQNEPPYGYLSIASVLITDLTSTTEHTFLNVEIPISEFSTSLRLDFNDGSSLIEFSDFSSCDEFVYLDITVEECSCEEIYIEFLEVNCVDPNNTPNDPSDDEIEYVFIANKGTAGMGSSSGGSYGIANGCEQGEGGIYCETPEVPGEFGEENTATTGTNAGTGGGSRSFTIFYGDGCEYTIEFPDFDDFPEFDPNTTVNPCDECELDPNKLLPGICGCGNPEPGTPCNDGDPDTGYDTIQPDCSCAGLAVSNEISLIDPCTCLNNATNEFNGQFSETIQIESSTPGESWYIISQTGFFDINSPTSPPDLPIPYPIGPGGITFTQGDTDGIDNDNDSSVDEADENLFYTLPGIHVDGQGYTLIISNGIENLTLFNECYYPNIQINLPSIVSSESLPIDLTGLAVGINLPQNVAANGNFAFDLCDASGNPIETGISSLGIGLEAGNYILKVTFDEDDSPVTFPPISGTPGCIQPKSFLFKIVTPNCPN